MTDTRPISKFLMMGLPESGKSTFVAALWEVVRSNDVPEAMKIGTLRGDYSYVNALHKLWSEGQPLSRTKVGKEGIVSIPLRNRSENTQLSGEIEVLLPDLSGESFDAQWEKREMSKDYYQHLTEATGLMVFVHSQKFNRGDLIDSIVKELEAAITEITEADTEEIADPLKDKTTKTTSSQLEVKTEEVPLQESIPFDPNDVPTQTKVVDLLLQALRLIGPRKISKVVLIVSAWDLVKDEGNSPREWLEKTMPLLAQFLESNPERFKYRVFGISAQGGELNIKEPFSKSRIELLKNNDSKRILVTDGKLEHHNITAPLQWLMQE